MRVVARSHFCLPNLRLLRISNQYFPFSVLQNAIAGGICCEICHTLQDDHLSNTFYLIDKLCSPKSMTNCETILPNNDSKCFKLYESGNGFTRDA